MCLITSNVCKHKIVFSSNNFIYSSLVLVSYAILARLIVLTLIDPTSNAVPPMLLKKGVLISETNLKQFLV